MKTSTLLVLTVCFVFHPIIGPISINADEPETKVAETKAAVPKSETPKKVLFIAGAPSHKNGEHEHRAGCMLLAKALNNSELNIEAQVHHYGWPKDESILEGIDALIIYADAGGRLDSKAKFIDEKVKAGMGIMFLHYGVHPTEEMGDKYFNQWIGGYFHDKKSVNPHWIAELEPRVGHPVANGLPEKFPAFDEFYYNITHPEKCDCCHPLATAMPEPERMVRYNNKWTAEGEACFGTKQALMWCRDPSLVKDGKGGRGVGFTGGHYHRNWAIDEFRGLVLNAIVWTAGMEVPKEGVPSQTITKEDINLNLDKPTAKPIELPTKALLEQSSQPIPKKKKGKQTKKKG